MLFRERSKTVHKRISSNKRTFDKMGVKPILYYLHNITVLTTRNRKVDDFK